jgi:hypothetical protein
MLKTSITDILGKGAEIGQDEEDNDIPKKNAKQRFKSVDGGK